MEINQNAGYLDTTPTIPVKISANPVSPQIKLYDPSNDQISVLSHLLAGAQVGWLVTIPQ